MVHYNSNSPKAISAVLQVGGKQVDALVTIFDRSLEVLLTSEEHLNIEYVERNFISGTTADLKYICLIDIALRQSGQHYNNIGGRSSWNAVITARYLAMSDCPFEPSSSNITSVYILNDKISQICHDPTTLTSIVESQDAIKTLAKHAFVESEDKETDWKSEVLVKHDKGNSFEATISNGLIFGSPTTPKVSFGNEMQLVDNRYVVGIEFSELTDFYDVLSKCTTMVRLCEFSYGTEIVLDRLELIRPDVTRVIDGKETKYPNIVEVYFFDLGFGTRRISDDAWKSGSHRNWTDSLVAPAKNRVEFQDVVAHWFETDSHRSEARERLLDGLRNGTSFPHNRLIGVCAAFELLPNNSKPVQNLPAEVVDLTEKLNVAIKNQNLEKEWTDRFKQNLGQVKNVRTRDIIQHRLNQIRQGDPNFLPKAELVLIHAVKLRNRLIHGSSTKLSNSENLRFQPFFTSVLEAIFVFSELMNSGYDLKSLWTPSFPRDHPLFLTISDFDLYIKELEELLK